ncbi:UDP-N-acetylglucosamine--dolichyl-phosphate N-acetylglucosaminephosphotransferase [Rhizophagus clarus]|uniref:UDP-N-acetylglucosamine--dolichyl-phosphate N-acetylglucosaminephosphotransferase n=1 Tax=Rhizophagus clarus TaxID=94130 RepID=A0A8H3MEE5_9GLOM|nr:UDP-N-acetylglucosamine--dolichyl-phosphate N-acetylglucosaminephosphotransferase [Rhizophagus clarus]
MNRLCSPESMGVVCATVYLMCMFFFIPFPFMEWFTGKGIISRSEEFHAPTFPHHKLGEFLSAMLSLQSMTFLGFADDIFDISDTDTFTLYVWANYRFRFFILYIHGHDGNVLLIDCPRHRLPRFNPSTNKLEYSKVKVQKPLKKPALYVIRIFEILGLVKTKDENNSIEVNNFTLMNLLLLKFGPLHERKLAILVIIVQILASCLSFIIRYRLVHFFYEI